jgi:hypothetical protein
LGQYAVAVLHLRHPFGRDKTTSLDMAQTGGSQPLNQLAAQLNTERLRLIL